MHISDPMAYIKLQPRQILHAQQCTANNEFETDISDAIVYRDLGFFCILSTFRTGNLMGIFSVP